VETTLGRHVVVHDLRTGELEQRQEDALGGVPEIEVFHGRLAHDGRGIHRLLAHRHRRHVHARVQVGFAVVAGVIAERALHHQRFGRIDVPFDHEIRFGRHFEIARDRLGQLHRRTTQEAGEDELVDHGRQRRAGAVHARRIGAHGNAHGHHLAALGHLPQMLGAGLVALPVHGHIALAELLHAIHAHVANAARRILGDHHGERDVRPPSSGQQVSTGSCRDRSRRPSTRSPDTPACRCSCAAETWRPRTAAAAARACP
jgi:hypothetical protein